MARSKLPEHPTAIRGIVGIDEIAGAVESHRLAGERIVLTNGAFDLLHVGHLAVLEGARALGDCLVVGVNSDRSVRELKGPARPLVGEADRARIIAALRVADLVVIFDERTAERLVRLVRPDTYVKGGDYARNPPPEAPVVQEMGGRVAYVPLEPDRSSTTLVERIAQRYRHDPA
jgi:rfaE bifunctional protein nucleotidyltransferase chain/domain